jgi:dienelactone hydrolase
LNRRHFLKNVAETGLGTAIANSSGVTLAAEEERQRDLAFLLRVLEPSRAPQTGRINATDRTWEDWQRRTGELPPRFSELPAHPFLPNLLAGLKSRADWRKRRELIRKDVEHLLTGRMPPAPDNLRAVVIGERHENTILVRDVRLEFGPDHRGTLRVQLLIPPADRPRPVFLTNHNRKRPWAATAVARGYIGAIYFAADPVYGPEDDSDKFIELYPDYDFSCLARWAWAASRAVDYLYTVPEVDRACIAISGHSRNAKQAVIAGAFDSRITAVVPSSGNTGEGNPWRYTSDPFVTESIEQITTVFPHWFHPRLRFFAGREDKLPFDQTSVLALIAPRPLLLTCSYTEDQGSDFGFEQNFRALREIYGFLGATDKVGLRLRAGPHPTTAGDIEAYLDFLDQAFGRSSAPAAEPTFVFGYTFERWNTRVDSAAQMFTGGDPLRWALGPEPPQTPFPTVGPGHGMVSAGWMDGFYERPIRSQTMKSIAVAFGVDLKADLYLPVRSDGKLPLVIWLHPFSYSTGYSRYAKAPFEELTRRGYAVLAFDQIGFGTRVEHAKEFYTRYPNWSLMGKMVADTRAAITAVSALDTVDPSAVYLLGYALGGKVALWTAACDPRPTAAVAVASITPLRTSKNVEGLRAYSDLHGLLPRLGLYAGDPVALPFDYDDVLRKLGSRKALVIAPTHDRYTDLDALRALVARCANAELQTPEDFNRFPRSTQKLAFDWLDRQNR